MIKRTGKVVFLVFALQSFRQTVAVLFFQLKIKTPRDKKELQHPSG